MTIILRNNEKISTQLVKLKDKENSVQEKVIEKNDEEFPKLNTDGLDQKEVENCISNLFTSYQRETIIPEAFQTNEAKKI